MEPGVQSANMCLYRITKRHAASRKVRRAYKVFEEWDERILAGKDGLAFVYYAGSGLTRDVTLDKWLRASEARVRLEQHSEGEAKEYTSGFHAFPRRRDAEAFMRGHAVGRLLCVVPVRLRAVMYTGEQGGACVVVAREMYVSGRVFEG